VDGPKAISEFQVNKPLTLTQANTGTSWVDLVVKESGHGFDTKLVAQAEATQRKLSIQRFGQPSATLSCALAGTLISLRAAKQQGTRLAYLRLLINLRNRGIQRPLTQVRPNR